MSPHIENRAHVALLTFLLAAFVGRVLAQLIQASVGVTWLPPFAAWAAGGLPYPALLAIQIAIIAAAVLTIRKLARGRIRPRRTWARWLTWLGGVYFAAMAARLAAGQTFLADQPWFAASLPAIFHLVLAAFLLTLGHYHRTRR